MKWKISKKFGLKNKKLTAIIICIVIVIISIFLFSFLDLSKKESVGDVLTTKQVSDIDRTSDCADGLLLVKDKQATEQNDKIALSLYKANCLAVTKQYDQARQEYKTVIDYYNGKGNVRSANNVKDQLKQVDDLQKNDDGQPYRKPRIRATPEGINM